jgi:hypothetical protein
MVVPINIDEKILPQTAQNTFYRLDEVIESGKRSTD